MKRERKVEEEMRAAGVDRTGRDQTEESGDNKRWRNEACLKWQMERSMSGSQREKEREGEIVSGRRRRSGRD